MSLPETSRSAAGRVLGAGAARAVTRALPEEVPVAVTVNGSTQAVLMATPADLEDFGLGFALTEGLVAAPGEVEDLEVVTVAQGIEVRLWVEDAIADRLGARRRAMLGPVGCGLCGIDSLEQALRPVPRVGGPLVLTPAEAAGAVEALRTQQPLHDRTHAAHAAGFLVPGQGIVAAREDVGRHNALDKLVGALARAGIDGASGAVVLTSRVSVEMVQKTAMAGAPVLIAVSAPTAHALRLAEAAGMTLAAFARGGSVEVYAHPDRIQDRSSSHVA